ncbi:MAG: hypothetical protein ACFFDN_13015 [Candidatus Hodarchaeota archaeon]
MQSKVVSLNTIPSPQENIGLQPSGLWPNNGILLCNAPNEQGDVYGAAQMCSDGSGGAIIVWSDERNKGSTFSDIYAQRIDEDGRMLWGLNGIIIADTANTESNPQIISDGSGGAIIVWQVYVSGSFDIYAQRVDSNGIKLWGSSVAVSTASSSQIYPRLCTDGAGGAIITWEDARNPPLNANDVYVQWINATGDAEWTLDGIAICTATYGGHHRYPKICSDENGGAIIAWEDNRTYPTNYNIYAQKINSSGLTEWLANGTVICNAGGSQTGVEITSDGAGGAVISWMDSRTGTRVYTQRINSNGVTQWTNNGIQLSPYLCWDVHMCSDGAGGAIMAWRDDRSGGLGDIIAQRVDTNGNLKWGVNATVVCAMNDNQYVTGISGDGNGGAVIVWRDMRTGNYSNFDVYAQQVNSKGIGKWKTNGAPICTETSNQKDATVCITTTGVALFCWTDNRTFATTDWDLYIYGKSVIVEIEIDFTPILIAVGLSQPRLLEKILNLLLSPMVLGGIAIVEFLIILIFVFARKKQ